MRTFPFAFTPLYQATGLPLGITPRTCRVELDETALRVRFGLWTVETAMVNVAGTEVTGPYAIYRTVGPAHLSLRDRGLTFATNPERGLCVRFHMPVAGLEPTGRLRHPALTVTVADVDGLAAALGPPEGA